MTSKLNVGRGSSRNIQKELKNMKILTKIKKLISKKNLTSVSVSKNKNNHTTKTTQWKKIIYDYKKKNDLNMILEARETFKIVDKDNDNKTQIGSRNIAFKININKPLNYKDFKKLYNSTNIIVSKENQVIIKPFDKIEIQINYEKNKNENYKEHLTYIVKKVTWSEALSDDGIERKITIHTLAHLNPEEQKQIDKKLKIQHELNELFKQPK